jgi:hypothetical protein
VRNPERRPRVRAVNSGQQRADFFRATNINRFPFLVVLHLEHPQHTKDNRSSPRFTRLENNSKMPDIDCIREQLSMYPGSKLGFVIYRLTYSDDAQWARFMSHLNTRIRLDLEEEGNGDLFSHIDWDVQEDSELDGAFDETVRE